MNKQKYLMTSGAVTHTLLSKTQRQHPWVTVRRKRILQKGGEKGLKGCKPVTPSLGGS